MKSHVSREKIGVFGSAFNPPSLGHFDAIKQAAKVFDRIFLVPSAAHAFAKDMIPFHHRVAMLEHFVLEAAASEAIVPCKLEVCAVEAELFGRHPDKPVYTFDLLTHLETAFPDSELGYIRGPDNADPKVWSRYYKSADIDRRWNIFTVEERTDIRSTYIRDLLSSNSSDDNLDRELQKLLFPSVYEYILKHRLYQTLAN